MFIRNTEHLRRKVIRAKLDILSRAKHWFIPVIHPLESFTLEMPVLCTQKMHKYPENKEKTIGRLHTGLLEFSSKNVSIKVNDKLM